MNLYYDLHIHTALSPCAENEMTPNNIVNMAALLGLDVIAATDHNETGNARALIKAAENNELDLIVLPGMELETAEEIHVVCLFDEIKAAGDFCAFVDGRRANIKNKPQIFGEQLYMDEEDNVTGTRESLLLTATGISIGEAFETVRDMGGAVFPAHIDRDSYSVLSALGIIPEEIRAGLVEISRNIGDPDAYMLEKRKLLGGAKRFILNSDSHNLASIFEAQNTVAVEEKTAKAVIAALKKLAEI